MDRADPGAVEHVNGTTPLSIIADITRRLHELRHLMDKNPVGERYRDVTPIELTCGGVECFSGRRAYFDIDLGFTIKNGSSGSGSQRAIAPERR